MVATLTVSGDRALLTYAVYQPQIESAEQVTEAALAVTISVLRSLCGPDWHPAEVLVPRRMPAETVPYRHHFRAPVRFDQDTAALVFWAADLKRRIVGADPMLREVLEVRFRQMRADAGSAFSDDIRRLLRMRLTSRHCSAEDIAELLAMHRRTLSRRLKGGMGYRAITNEIRFEIGQQLLEDTEVSLGQIAAALGYSETSAFTRAFRRWSGQTRPPGGISRLR